MSVKDVKYVYSQICEQYKEMVENIKDLEKEAAEGIVDPDRITQMQLQVEPIKQNYERWSYMMYLLYQPQRKQKRSEYAKRNLSMVKNLSLNNSIESVMTENRKALDKMKG